MLTDAIAKIRLEKHHDAYGSPRVHKELLRRGVSWCLNTVAKYMNAAGISGILPKALISTYLSFFPVTVGMVKGLRSPEIIHLDLMHTYSASRSQTFWKLRWPSSMPYLFTSLKIAVAISLVGAIVGEMPTGAVAGLGARLLAGSYYGQTIQIWSALFMAAALAAVLVMLVSIAHGYVLRRMGEKPV